MAGYQDDGAGRQAKIMRRPASGLRGQVAIPEGRDERRLQAFFNPRDIGLVAAASSYPSARRLEPLSRTTP